MAQQLAIRLKGSEFLALPIKVERRKLYGWTAMRATTPEGEICTLGGLSSDGTTIVAPGLTKSGMVNSDGCWLDRNETMAVNPDGTPARLIPSSFETGLDLGEKADMTELLDLNINAVYQISEGFSGLAEAVGDDIFRVNFLYKPSYEANQAFILATNEGVFLLAGTQGTYLPIGIEQEGVFDESPDDEDSEEDLDFNMF